MTDYARCYFRLFPFLMAWPVSSALFNSFVGHQKKHCERLSEVFLGSTRKCAAQSATESISELFARNLFSAYQTHFHKRSHSSYRNVARLQKGGMRRIIFSSHPPTSRSRSMARETRLHKRMSHKQRTSSWKRASVYVKRATKSGAV